MTSSRNPESAVLSRRIKEEAARLGFALAGIVPAAPALSHGFYEQWLARGFGGEMAYLRRHAEAKRDPRQLEPSARSLIVLGYPYPAAPPDSLALNSAAPYPESQLRGRISRYALEADYHDVLGGKLRRLAGFIEESTGQPLTARPCVDSAPVMEREYAARAGLGWVGRNAMLIHWKLGSWLLLAELLVDLELAWDTPPRPGNRQARRPRNSPSEDTVPSPPLNLRESCGTCRACIEACPTGAIVGDKTVDSRRCISYLTIELKGPIPIELRPAMGDWVFGCDICQEVCPWNRKAPQARQSPAGSANAEEALDPAPSLPALLAMDEGAFRSQYRHTPLWRAKRRGVLRNAAIALGNLADGSNKLGSEEPGEEVESALTALSGALRDAEPLVRGAAAWALGRMAMAPLNLPEARGTLTAALEAERDPTVREEIAAALR